MKNNSKKESNVKEQIKKFGLYLADHIPNTKFFKNRAYNIVADKDVGAQTGATKKDIIELAFKTPEEEDTNKYMFIYGADTRRPETTIGQAYDWQNDIDKNGYTDVRAYEGVLNPYNEYLIDSRNKGLIEEFARVGYTPIININDEYSDPVTHRLDSETPYFDDVHSYRPRFHMNNGQVVVSASDLYDFGKNYTGDFQELADERSDSQISPYMLEMQRRALNSVGQPYLLVQKNIPVRFVDNPQGSEINRVNNFTNQVINNLSDQEIARITNTGYIEPAIIFQKKGGSIHIKKKNRGKFTEYCGGKVTEECIAKGKKSKDPKIRKRATFAANSRRWKHENGGILKAQNGTPYGLPGGVPSYMQVQPLSPIGIALNQAKASAKMKGEQQPLPGVKEVVGPDGKKVAIRTEQPLVPLEQSIAEWLPGTGDVAEVGYIADDVKNGRYGSAALAAGLMFLPGAAAHKIIDLNGIKKVNVKLEDPTKYWYVAHQTGSSNFSKIAQDGLQTGSGLNGTALYLTEEYMDDFANGRLKQKHLSHEGADGLVVMKFPKEKFPSGDLDDISIRLMDLGESNSFEVPPEYLQFFKRDQFKKGGKL